MIYKTSQSVEFLIDDIDTPMVHNHTWSSTAGGYISTSFRVNGKVIRQRLHRMIMGLQNNDERYVDHINGNILDNQRKNLRICSKKDNCRNRIKRNTKVSSIYKGVQKVNLKKNPAWIARICVDGKGMCLGYYKDEKMAALRYDSAARQYFGEFAKCNFV